MTAEQRDAAAIAAELVPALEKLTDEVDRGARFPLEGMALLRATPLMGLLVPRHYGGSGGSLRELVRIARVLSSGCTTTAFVWAMHCQQVDSLARHAAPELADKVLPRIARGELYLGSVTTEPGNDGRLFANDAPLEERDDVLHFRRVAPIVTGGRHADAFMITLRASAQAPASAVTLLYAERDALELVETRSWDALGMRGTESIGLDIRGTAQPWQVVGEPGGFRAIAIESMIPSGHIAWSACWLGAAAAATERVVRELRRSVKAPGDAAFDLKAVRLARLRTRLELADTYLHAVSAEVDEARRLGRSLSGPATQIHLNTLKVAASEASYAVANELIELTGLAGGYTRGASGLERLLRDLRSASLNYANDRLLSATGRLVLMDPAGTFADGDARESEEDRGIARSAASR